MLNKNKMAAFALVLTMWILSIVTPSTNAKTISGKEYKQAVASYYNTGKVTANGERFYPNRATFASRHLPFGTKVEFATVRNGKITKVVARCNDRGPFVKGRTFDLSHGVAKRLGVTGVSKVFYRVVERPQAKNIKASTNKGQKEHAAVSNQRRKNRISKKPHPGGSLSRSVPRSRVVKAHRHHH